MTNKSDGAGFSPAVNPDRLREAIGFIDAAGIGSVGREIEEYENNLNRTEAEIQEDDFHASLSFRLALDPEYHQKMQVLIEARDAAAKAIASLWNVFDEVAESREELEVDIARTLDEEYDARFAAKEAAAEATANV